MARKQIPAAIRKAEGFRGHRTKAELAAMAGPSFALASDPKPPKYLGKHAKDYWERMYPVLDSVGLLKQAGMGMFEQMCVAWGMCRSLSDKIDMDSSLNLPATLEFIKERRAQQSLFRQLSEQFGMTPVTEGKVGAAASHPKADPIEAAMGIQ